MQASDLIYDWNKEDNVTSRTIQIRDETLRDGLQGGVPRFPTIEEKLQLLTRADRLGLQEARIGFPAQETAYQECLALCKGARERVCLIFDM